SEFLYSARNQLLGVISLVKPGTVNTEVEVKVADGVNVVAIVTNESAQDMALATGKAIMALFKTSSVILAVPKP
ncbi:MAG TPA: TOBE domain-containing protein, partial [Methyloradius sp.]